jgi:hypothetical protein
MAVGKIGTEFLVNTYTNNNQVDASTALLSNGNFAVVWASDGQDGSGWGIYSQIFTSAAIKQGVEFRVNSYMKNRQGNPYIAHLNNGNFVVVWHSDGQDGSGLGVYGQIFTNIGVKQEVEFRINSYVQNHQAYPNAALLSNGNFVVVWRSYGQDIANQWSVYAQIFKDSGEKQGTEFQVSTYVEGGIGSGSELFQSVTGLSNSFVVTWETKKEGNGYGIYGQLFGNNGIKQGFDFLVNNYTLGEQWYPSTALLSDGNFVVIWQSHNQDGSGWGIYGQIFTSAAIKHGVEFRVNSYTLNDQKLNDQLLQSVASLDSNNFVVVYSSISDEENVKGGVYGQIFNNDGVKQGTEFHANTYMTDTQNNPSVSSVRQ